MGQPGQPEQTSKLLEHFVVVIQTPTVLQEQLPLLLDIAIST